MKSYEFRAFGTDLRRMNAFEVREETVLSVQPDAKKRAMAVTELERRRQARAPKRLRTPLGLPAKLIPVTVIVAAAAYWLLF